MTLKTTFYDPLKPDGIELGDLSLAAIIDHFEKVDWNAYLEKGASARLDDVYYSPCIEVENKESKNGLVITAGGKPHHYTFSIFYKRPKNVKTFFGLLNKVDENYTTSIESQTKNDALDCINALSRGDTAYLSKKIGA